MSKRERNGRGSAGGTGISKPRAGVAHDDGASERCDAGLSPFGIRLWVALAFAVAAVVILLVVWVRIADQSVVYGTLIIPWSLFVACVGCLAFIGWGHIAQILLRVQRPASAGLLGAWGLAFSTVVGGVLNALGLISTGVAVGYLIVGVVAAGWLGFGRRREFPAYARQGLRFRRSFFLIGGVVLLASITAYVILTGALTGLNPHDDRHAYMVFPEKMLQTGSEGRDPFSERRMCEYGGQSFLHALLQRLLNAKASNSLDTGAAWLLVMALVWGHAKRGGASAGIRLLLLLGLQAFALPPISNITSMTTGLVLFYGLIWTFADSRGESALTRAALMGMLLAGILSLKNTFIPPAGLLTLTLYLVVPSTAPLRRRGGELVLAGVIALALLAPWMISMYRSNGTFLYPILGRGFEGSQYGDFIPVACGSFALTSRTLASLTRSLPFITGLPLVLILFFGRGETVSGKRVVLASFLAIWVSAIFVGITSDFGVGTRYDYPFTMAITVFLVAEGLGLVIRAGGSSRGRSFWATLVVLGLLSAQGLRINFVTGAAEGGYSWGMSKIVVTRRPALGILSMPTWIAASYYEPRAQKRGAWNVQSSFRLNSRDVVAVQHAIPAGERILARLSDPYLLDFSRNEINIIDWPGGSSPPPGIPCFGTAEALAGYLRNQGIRYVMYSYATQAGFSREEFADRLKAGNINYAGRLATTARYTFAFQDRLLELSTIYRVLAYDERTFALDLGSRAR